MLGPTLAPEDVPRFEPAACPVGVPIGVRVNCGYLVVFQDRHDPGSRTIRLAAAVLKSRGNHPAPDPVVYLQGGPGASTIGTLASWTGSPFLESRDLVLLEQRGTQYSAPWLDCPEVNRAQVENFALVLGNEQETARTVAAAAQCRDRLVSMGINLAAYNGATSAADLEDLRRVLGYDKWNLYGASYGTRLALTVMRDFPQGVRSVILDSVDLPQADNYVEFAPNVTEAFKHLFDKCAADAKCNAAYPHLETVFYDLVKRMNAQPVAVSVSFFPYNLLLTGDDFALGLHVALQNNRMASFLPMMIYQLYDGHHDVLLPLAEQGIPFLLTLTRGMYYSVQCHDCTQPSSYTPDTAPTAVAAGPLPSFFSMPHSDLAICSIWGAGKGGPIEHEPVHSDIPTLVMSGEYDPITPPRWGKLAAETLANGFFFEFRGLSHGATFSGDPCPLTMALAFIQNPQIPPNASCMARMPGLSFITEDDLYLTSAFYRMNASLRAGRDPLLLGVLGFCLLFFSVEILALPGNMLRMLQRQSRPIARMTWLARGLAVATAGLNLVFLIGLALALRKTIATNWLVLAFGLPASAASLFLILPLTTVLAVGMLVCAILVWKSRVWTVVGRVHYSLVTLAALAFVWFLIYWNLLGP